MELLRSRFDKKRVVRSDRLRKIKIGRYVTVAGKHTDKDIVWSVREQVA